MPAMNRLAASQREFAVARQIPYAAHVAENLVKTHAGDFVQVFRLAGASFESADDETLNNWHERLNVTWRNIASPNVALWAHVLRRREYAVADAEQTKGFAARLARILKGLAHSYELSDRTRAENLLEEALKGIDIERADENDAELLSMLGAIRLRGGDLIGAKESLEPALRLFEERVGERDPLLADPLLALGITYLKLRQPADARTVLERTLELAEAMVGPTHTHTLTTARVLGEVLIDLREIPAAHALLKKTVERVDASGVRGNSAVVELLYMYGLTAREVDGPAEARCYWRRALRIAREHNLGALEKTLAESLRWLHSQGPQQR